MLTRSLFGNADTRIEINRLLNNLPKWANNLPAFRKIVRFFFPVWQLLKQVTKAIHKMPNWMFTVAVVIGLARIALWVGSDKDVQIQSIGDLFSKNVIKVVFEAAESIAITAAAMLYFKEAPDRKTRMRYEAAQVLDNAAAAKVSTSYARIIALQDLNNDGFVLDGLDVPVSDLTRIQLPNAKLRNANFQGSSLCGVDLSKADLVKANFQGANLSDANLREVELRDADLRETDLSSAELAKANLSRAKLSGANLTEVNLRGANLWEADLAEANLEGADLSQANLERANLSQANLGGANLSRTSLKGATLLPSQLQTARLHQTILPDGSISK
jgi:BTB/POZ domain-containing protein KCTD9